MQRGSSRVKMEQGVQRMQGVKNPGPLTSQRMDSGEQVKLLNRPYAILPRLQDLTLPTINTIDSENEKGGETVLFQEFRFKISPARSQS